MADRGALGARAERLKAIAVEEGFDFAGIARLEPSSRGDVFLRWLSEGGHAEMDYLERRTAVRLDPRRVFSGARSALCVGLRYAPLEGESVPANDLWPRVARYARGRDYHLVMEKRLRSMARRVEEDFPGARTRSYVDTGPVLEREIANRAGLGAVGKNTCLLRQDGGSWFLLGELFLSLDLEPDDPIADMCGSCTLCLEACPTGALPEPYRLDSDRCISYWTIEHRGSLPDEARERLGDWVFGCDICQEVCPWNRRRQDPADHPDLRLPPERAELDLAGLLRIGREEYVGRFRASPMKRPKQEGLQRNAAVAMGNRGDSRYVPTLAAALREDSSPLVRAHAAWALGKIGGAAATEVLEERRGVEVDSEVSEEIERALGRKG